MSNLVCDNCGHDYGKYTEELDKLERCTYCGSNKLNRYLYLSDRIGLHENIKGKSNKLPGKKKPAIEFQAGEERSVSLNKWVNKSRVIDRENNRYYEEVVDPDTGDVLHKCEEPLTKHFGPGSAKKKEMKTKMLTIIMAGGRGTRISELFPDIPKPLIPIENIPVLEREIVSLRDQGFTDFILTVSYLHEKIEEYFGDGSRLGVKIEYFVEETPLGNTGALFKLRDRIGDSPFLLLNADAVFDIDFNRLVSYHYSHGGLATILTHPNSHPYDSGLIISENDVVMKWLAKEDERPKYYNNRVNAGMHVLDPAVLDLVDGSRVGEKDENGKIIKIDLDRQILKPLAGTGKLISYDSPEYVKDMGTPDRYYEVVEDFKAGRVKGKNLNFKQKAVFLDRDGTINKYVGFLRDIEQFELLPEVAEAIKLINKSGYLAIVITNQPVIARGEVTVDELETINKKLETELGY